MIQVEDEQFNIYITKTLTDTAHQLVNNPEEVQTIINTKLFELIGAFADVLIQLDQRLEKVEKIVEKWD